MGFQGSTYRSSRCISLDLSWLVYYVYIKLRGWLPSVFLLHMPTDTITSKKTLKQATEKNSNTPVLNLSISKFNCHLFKKAVSFKSSFVTYLSCFFVHHHHHHHHHIALVARISLTLSRHFSLSFIALGWSSGQHPVSSHSCWMYVRAGRPAFARPCVGIHKSTSVMSSSLLLQHIWFV